MKIFVGDLIKGVFEQKEINLSETIEDFEIAGDEIKLTSPVSLKGIIANENGILKLDGMLKLELELKCHRCLKELKTEFSLKINECFSNAESIHEDFYKFSGNDIDLTEMLTDVIITNMPMKVLCEEDCKGLCSYCGDNLNHKECNCKKEDYDPRLEKLRQLKNNF